MRKLCVLLAALLPTQSLAETYPFEGKWDCEVATFTFTPDIYNNGSEDMPITDIAEEDGVYLLSFADDYQISVALNPDGTLSWLSGASGDAFTCTAVN